MPKNIVNLLLVLISLTILLFGVWFVIDTLGSEHPKQKPGPGANNSQSETLDLSYKNLESVPKSTYENINLTRLILAHNQIKSLHSEIGQLVNLEDLDVSYNQIEGALPAEIRKISGLQSINASHNKITAIPAEIGQLSSLSVLDYSHNNLNTMPNEIVNCRMLFMLSLSYNRYQIVPSGVLKLTKLATLDLTGNPLKSGELERVKANLPNTNIMF